jgi:Tfp pilus assembly ATPase PilU
MQRGRLSAIKELMIKAEEEGVCSFDQSLFTLYQYGKITAEEAIRHATSGTDMSLQIRLFVTDNNTDGTDGHGRTHPVNVDATASHVIAEDASNGGIP